MTTRPLTLVQAVFVALLISTVPSAAPAQQQEEQVQPVAPPEQEKTTEEPSQQKPAENAPEQQQGSVLIPHQGMPPLEESEGTTPKEEDATPTAEAGSYTIKQGDTLWDIANAFMKDPFLWPFIWKANQYITDPDLIYPGNKLAIPSLAPIERALQAQPEMKEQLVEKQTTTAEKQAEKPAVKPAEKPLAKRQPLPAAPALPKGGEQAVVSKLILPEEAQAPIIDKYSMLNAGFVNPEESKDVIVGSKEEKTIFGYDDIVYVAIHSKENANIGDKFLIYKPLHNVRHPITGKDYGTLIKVLGILNLTEKGKPGTFAARISLSFDSIGKGSLLTPYQEPSLVYEPAHKKQKDIAGYILEIVDTRTINAQVDIVYLDKGSSDGVDPGDRFLVISKPKGTAYPTVILGEAQVFLVKEHTSTAVVRKSNNVIVKGDKIVFKK